MDLLFESLPPGPPYFPEDYLTDQMERFLAGEIVREKILHHTREELPHAVAVRVEEFHQEDRLIRIRATILVERESQKGILIGKGGEVCEVLKVGGQRRSGNDLSLGQARSLAEGGRGGASRCAPELGSRRFRSRGSYQGARFAESEPGLAFSEIPDRRLCLNVGGVIPGAFKQFLIILDAKVARYRNDATRFVGYEMEIDLHYATPCSSKKG